MTVIRRFLLVGTILVLPAIAYAQEAVLTGTLTDSTGGVLPGVTVTAVLEATGNTFVAVTDGRGTYTIPVRVGVYRITAELQGFTTVMRTDVQLLVGQTATVNIEMALAGVTESVIVRAEAPLINTTTSSLGGNIDPRQVQELPVYGRNWMALALLAPGSRTSTTEVETPLPDRGGDVREFQLNMDGQQVSAEMGTGGQPKYSQDAIAEFQFIANRFDATLGRSTGVQVNVVTKSGTNQLSGLFRGNFRSSRFNAENPVLNRVEPIDNQQFSTAVGGPMVKDKVHYFGNFEYEREPRTSIWNTPYPSFNAELTGTNNIKKGAVRLDYELSPQTRLMGKFSRTATWEPFGGSGQNHPAGTSTNGDYNRESFVRLTQVLSNRALNEIQGGQAVYGFHQEPLTSWSNAWYAAQGFPIGSPRIIFRGFQIAQNRNLPRHQDQWVWSVRDNFTYLYEAGGHHDLRLGGEFLNRHQIQANRRNSTGEIDARGGPIPANLEALFPDPFNVDTWNLAAISSITRSYMVGVGNFDNNVYAQKLAAWVQDDWKISDRLTLNLGLRYDVAINAFANDVSFPPWQEAGRPNDWTNLQPRLGFAYQLDDRTVLRGGAGLYYGDAMGNDESTATGNSIISQIRYENDGRPDFAANPTNGRPLPTYDEAQQQFCYANNNAPGCLLQDVSEFVGPHEYVHLPRTFQTSIGIQRQLGDTAAIEVDYVYGQGRNEKNQVGNVNLTFDPVTGVNYPFGDRSRRFNPNWGQVSMSVHNGRSAYHGLRTSFSKRFSAHWQATATYALSGFWDAGSPPFSGLEPAPFATAPDLGGEWSLSENDQRHRAVFNGIWQVGRGFQVSGLHYIGAGIRLPHTYGGDFRDARTGESRLRPDGTIVPLNDLIAPAQNRTDLRLQQTIRLPGRASIDAIVDVFNVFNRPNWGIGTDESRSDYLRHISAEYRRAQVGFRLTF